MKIKPYLIVYNTNPDPSFNCENLDDFELKFFDNKSFDEKLYIQINSTIAEDRPIIFLDAQVELPPFWSDRLLESLNNSQVNVCSALSCGINSLSPLIDNDCYMGNQVELDNLIYLLQPPQLIYSNKVNYECFIIRNKKALLSLDDTTLWACNNLLVQAKSSQVLKLTDRIELGNQNPLPAHALAELQWRLKSYLNVNQHTINYPVLDKKPIMLHITMDWGGGVHKWINNYCQYETNYNHLILVSSGEFYRKRHGEILQLHYQNTQGVLINSFELEAPIKATCVKHPEYTTILDKIINQYQISQIIVSSLIGHSLTSLQTKVPTIRILHDYFPSWPILAAQLDQLQMTSNDVEKALSHSKDEPFGAISEKEYFHWRDSLHQLYQLDSVNIVAPSQSVIENLNKIDKKAYQKATIIPHAIKPFNPITYNNNSEIFQVLILGRINPIKGQFLIEEIIKGLAKDCYFTLLGTGKDGEKYQDYENVTVIKDYENEALEMLLQEIEPDIALIASQTSETFSYTLSELQQAGICTISTKYGALKDRIIDGETGFLCDNSPTEFCHLIESLKNNPNQIKKVREQLINLEFLSFEKVINQYRKILPVSSRSTTYQLLHSNTNSNAFAKKLQILNTEKLRIETLLNEAELSLIERAKWGKKLTASLKQAEKDIHLERVESEYLKNKITEETDRMMGEIEALKSNVYMIQSQLEETSQLLDDTQVELTSVYQSRSWRMTRPVRRFTTWSRHKRNAIKFRMKQLKTFPARAIRSLKTRGIVGTLNTVKQKTRSQKTEKPIKVELTQNYQPFKIKTVSQPDVSIVIPVYNHFEHTYNCLNSISKLSEFASFEVIVVDDCSTDETQKLIKNVSGITYQRQKQNGGFIESCNTGAHLAKGQYLMFLNNDTVVYDKWLDSLIDVFNNYPDAGLVGSKLVYPNNQLQEAGGIIFSDASGWNYGRMGNPDEPWYNHVRTVDYCSGASILVEASVFKQVGYFDERFKPAYYEDVDLAFLVRDQGKKVYYQPASKITHFEGISSGTDLTQGMKKYQVVNQSKFKDKWKEQLKSQPSVGADIETSRFHDKQKRILIFDACTPTPDQDAGSLRMINIIKILKELNYHVVFMPENLGFLEKYTVELQQLSVECIYVPSINNPVKYLKSKGKYFNHVLLSRHYVAEPVMPFIREYCPNAQIIFDTVDLHYLREQRMAEVNNDEKLYQSAAKTKNKELAIIEKTDITLVVSPYEVEVLSEEIPEANIQILSTVHTIYGCRKPFRKRKDIMFIGSYQHTPNVDAVIWFAESVFPLIEQELPELVFHIIGAKAPKQVKQLARNNIVFHGFVEDIEPFMDDVRIAVAPLRYGAGVKGKINSSMSYGQPVVGTKCAVEGMFTQEDKDVLTADSASQFAKQVIRLYQDEKLWNTISQGGLDNVQNFFSFESAKKSIEEILDV
jgi:GT2 family glycosyltransferase/glycosyltransferase involved in cell wall biosynthesis